jgi:hypothetical protein
VLLALVVGATGCPDRAAPEDARPSLRVRLPDAWKATPSPGGLHVGPPGRVVLQLETNTRAFPSGEELVAAVVREKVEKTQKLESPTFVGVRYRLTDEGLEGFLGARRAGPRTVWCASMKGASTDELDAAVEVCRGVSFDEEKG